MISASLAVEGHAHGLGLPGHHHSYMTYPDSWRTTVAVPPPPPPSVAPQKHAEFLRPAPKPLGAITTSNNIINSSISGRYNGGPSIPNGIRVAPQPCSPRSVGKYASPPSPVSVGPVNLTQQIKEEVVANEDLPNNSPTYSSTIAAAAAYSRLYPTAPYPNIYQSSLPPGPYPGLYPPPYSPIIRSFVQPPPLSPIEAYSPTSTSPGSIHNQMIAIPHAMKTSQTVLRDGGGARFPLVRPPMQAFKVPNGKEGSLKHRFLTRPPGENPTIHGTIVRKRLASSSGSSSTLSPPSTPTKPPLNTNNNTIPGNFTKGSLIQLATGELRRVEDMRTEDFIQSAEKCPELRLAESTVVRIEENPIAGTAHIMLSYNQNRTQVEFEATLEHPFFVYGQGWASCGPERTVQCYGLKVHRLQVGDILVSLTPRIHSIHSPPVQKTSTITTTATTTAMTARHFSSRTNTVDRTLLPPPAPLISPPNDDEPLDVSTHSSRKRRWSAPDEICDDEQTVVRKH